jgi:TonB family protein
MNRFQKKCLIASAGFHGFLLLLLVFGSAFFVSKEKPPPPPLNVVPTRWIEDALAGGGGNPDKPRTDERQKGETLLPQPDAAPAAVAPPKPRPTPPEPKPPKPEVRKTEPKKPDLPTPKPTKVVEPPKPVEKPPEAKPRIDLNSELQPIARTDKDKQKARKEAEAREAAREAARQQRIADAQRQKIAQRIDRATEAMQRGFNGGTQVEVGGPGGEAYANYGSLVRDAYDDAWQILPDLADDDEVATVRVTIARDGRVVGARFVGRSKSASMNRSVQRALDAVKRLPPFPDFIKEPERSFTIEFNLKAKRLVG